MGEKQFLQELATVESELAVYIADEKDDWLEVYKLMEKVKNEELFKARDLNSFTAWVSYLANTLAVGTSSIWRRYKAGRTFKEYAERTNLSLDDTKNLAVSYDTVASIETLAGRDSKKLDDFMDRAIAGKITREDVRKALREKRKTSKVPKSRHDRVKSGERTEIGTVTASDIVLELNRYYWLSDMVKAPIRLNNPIKTYLYSLDTELGVATGTSDHKRRFDGVIFENLTIDNTDNYGVNVYGIEIKINKYDLMNDRKMQEYTNFCDYFMIAIPNDDEMISIARNIKLPDWGIMIFDETQEDKKLKILDKPSKLKPIFKDQILENEILRLLGKSSKDFS